MYLEKYCWQIEDGRLWSQGRGAFVEIVPPDEILTPLTDNGHPAGTDYLRDCILFYGGSFGRLMTAAEKRRAVIAKYAPWFEELKQAKSGAEMQEPLDEEDLAAIKGEYLELQDAMKAELAALS